ncbi:MAG: hypothetical protein H0W73_08865 [Bacteroidetes bacterium]|nr:hypothetical protein [Bacteroidota bacterium]
MKAKLAILFSLLFTYGLRSQADSVIVPADLNVPDAIFITYTDFRYNKGILKEQIISSINKEQLDFVGKCLDKEIINYGDGQSTKEVKSNTVWGFIQNKTFYVNYKGSFYRVPVFGSLCYLVATVEVAGVGFYDPMFGPGVGSNGRRQEVREFLINFYDGIVNEFKMDQAEALLSRDKILYAEFKKLSRRKQKEQIFRYIRKYNEAHPVHFLK